MREKRNWGSKVKLERTASAGPEGTVSLVQAFDLSP